MFRDKMFNQWSTEKERDKERDKDRDSESYRNVERISEGVKST